VLPNGCHQDHQLEKLYLTANCLADNSLDVLGRFTNLHTLHAAYNSITTLPERYCILYIYVYTERKRERENTAIQRKPSCHVALKLTVLIFACCQLFLCYYTNEKKDDMV
jgi:hypothetical protein